MWEYVYRLLNVENETTWTTSWRLPLASSAVKNMMNAEEGERLVSEKLFVPVVVASEPFILATTEVASCQSLICAAVGVLEPFERTT